MARLNIDGIKKPVADLYPDDVGLRCVELKIPDDDGYLWVLAGFFAVLGNSWSWRGTRSDREARAQLWQIAYAATEWIQCMDCEQLIECLQPLFDNLRDQIIQDFTFKQFGTEDPTGVPLSEASRSADQAGSSNPTCDLDILWAQCLQTIEYGIALVTDALELAESATNDIELAQVITALPVLDELGADAIAAYASFLQQGITENYAAQVTSTYIEEAACALFCLAKGDCSITLERVQAVFQSRVETHFDSLFGALATIGDLFLYFIDLDIDGTIIADALHMIIWAGGVLTNQFLGDVGTKTLQTVLQLAVNDASDDHLLLCPDCPNEVSVPANVDAEPTGTDGEYDVTSGIDYHIFCEGTWNGGAGGEVDANGRPGIFEPLAYLPAEQVYCMMYRIGTSGDWLYAGADSIITAGSTGTIYFAMNDVAGSYGDNTGSITVIISVEP